MLHTTYTITESAMHTLHHGLHVIDQTTDDIESLSNGHLRLLEGESIKPLEDCFNFVLSQEFLRIFFCDIMIQVRPVDIRRDSLNFPWYISSVVRESTDNNSTIILTMVSVIARVGWISV